jgi:GT2 family glycosyltransferase/O-antigen/teichoic acid export membrane protein
VETSASSRVAVVVVNMNGAAVLDRCLDALARQTVRPAQVIVVDNASTDGSADRLEGRHPGVQVIRLAANIGFAAANNLAVARAAACEWVALLNPDAFPEPAWLERLLVAAAERPEFSFFGSRLLCADDPDTLDGTGDVLHVGGMAWRRDHGAEGRSARLEREEVFSPCAAAALYRRDAWEDAGGLEEGFFCYFEDTDLSFRLRLAGHRCLYVPDAVVHHVGSAIAGVESDFTVYHSFRNLNWTWARNMPSRLALLYLPQLLLVNALLLFAFAMRGRARVILRAQRDALGGLPRVLEERAAIQRGRRISARELRAAMARGPAGYVTTFARGLLRARGASFVVPVHDPVLFARNVLSNVGAQVWMLLLAFVTTPILINGLGTEAYGVYALVLVLVGYFAFLDLGLGVATIRHVAEHAAGGDERAVERTMRTAITAYVVLGGVGATALALSASVAVTALFDVPGGLRGAATTALVLAGVGFAVNMPLAVLNAVPNALQRIDLANALTVTFATLGSAGAIALVVSGRGLVAVLALSVALSAAAFVAFYVLARRLLPGISFRPGFDRAAFRALTSFGLLKFANQLSVQTVYHLDKILVAALVSVGAVAFYVVPVSVAQRLTGLVATVSTAFLPAATQLHAQGDRQRFRELYLRSARIVALVVLPVGMLLVVFAEPILDLWLGAEFAERSAWPLRFLALGYMLSALGTIPAVACDAVGRPGVTTAFSAAGAAFNATMCFVLIPRHGISGASVVILLQSLVSLPLFLLYVHRRVLTLPLADLLRQSLARPVAATALGAIVMALLLPLAGSLPGLLAVLAVSFLAYTALARIVGAWDPGEGRAVSRAFRRQAPAVEGS